MCLTRRRKQDVSDLIRPCLNEKRPIGPSSPQGSRVHVFSEASIDPLLAAVVGRNLSGLELLVPPYLSRTTLQFSFVLTPRHELMSGAKWRSFLSVLHVKDQFHFIERLQQQCFTGIPIQWLGGVCCRCVLVHHGKGKRVVVLVGIAQQR